VVFEPLYITHDEEEQRAADPAFRAQLADAISRGVAMFALAGAPAPTERAKI